MIIACDHRVPLPPYCFLFSSEASRMRFDERVTDVRKGRLHLPRDVRWSLRCSMICRKSAGQKRRQCAWRSVPVGSGVLVLTGCCSKLARAQAYACATSTWIGRGCATPERHVLMLARPSAPRGESSLRVIRGLGPPAWRCSKPAVFPFGCS